MYVELHAASAFSFLDGASLPEALVERAVELGYPALALLDRDGVYGAPRFHLAAKKAGLKAIIGAELTLAAVRDPGSGVRDPGGWLATPGEFGGAFRDQSESSNATTRERGERPVERGRAQQAIRPGPRTPDPGSRRVFTLPVLVASREGYKNLCRLVTEMKLRAPKGEGVLAIDELDGRVGGLVALIGRTAIDAPRFGVGGLVDRLVGIFGAGNVCMELQRHLLRDEESDNQALIDLAAAFHVPVIATNGVRFAQPADRPLYDVLTCIRHKTTLEHAGRRLTWNAERYLKAPDAMARLFGDLPQAIAATRELADRLDYTMADLGYKFPDYPVPRGETMASFLRKIVQAGARERYRPYHDRARRQVERELDLIEKLDLAGYFLIVWDIVNFCRQQDILVQGRGSAANSAVCYSLGITAVDPVGMDLLFERFLSEERGEWPDIDIDLPSGDRRERVIQHVYEKYGKLGAAMTANVITYRGRSAAREVGKTLSLEPAQIDRLAKVMNHFEWVDPKETIERNLREVGLDFHHPTIQLFGKLWGRIQDLPRHLGQHSGGMVICQGRLDEIVPLENASMPGRVVIQWDKDDCADMGLIKVDLLGLGMMAVLQDALQLVNAPNGRSDHPEFSNSSHTDPGPRTPDPGQREAVDLAHLPPNDPAVYKMLQEADTVGIFQVESRAQMATLPRLRPEKFYDVVVEVAIIRPGPIVGQMVHPYLKRRRGDEAVTYPHPSLQPILERTLGVPLFQEQLLRMAMVAAGFSGGEAEELRRAFGFKRSEHRMQQIEAKLRAGMARQGITGDAAEEIIRSITSFALYGFPESHAASFALLVYASAYLKAHYPAAFYTAMLNNQPMGFYHPATLVKDAQRHGVHFAPIDVLESDWECRVEPDGRVRLGLMYVNGLREETGRVIASSGERCPGPGIRGPGSGRMASCNRVKLETAMVGDSSLDQAWDDPELVEGSRLAIRSSNPGDGDNSLEFAAPFTDRCPKCGCDDQSMLEETPSGGFFCNICAHLWGEQLPNVAESRESSNEPQTTNHKLRTANVAESREPFRNEPRTANREVRTTTAANVADSDKLSGNEPRTTNHEPRFTSIEDLIAKTRVRRDELATLAEIGALNAFGHHRRSALWQIEKAIRPAGELFDELAIRESSADDVGDGRDPVGQAQFTHHRGPEPTMRTGNGHTSAPVLGKPPSNVAASNESSDNEPSAFVLGATADKRTANRELRAMTLSDVPERSKSSGHETRTANSEPRTTAAVMVARSSEPSVSGSRTPEPGSRLADVSPLRPMTPPERLMADYSGTSLTIGPHPLALRRAELALRGVLRAIDLPRGRHGRRVRVAGAVITRQRPGTAKGFVFLTLEDETGIANIIVQPDLFSVEKVTIVGEPYLLVEGLLQIQEGVTSVKAERVLPLAGGPPPESHDFR